LLLDVVILGAVRDLDMNGAHCTKIFGYLNPREGWLYKKGENSSYLLSIFRAMPTINDFML
jgi:hypothetical protein